MTEWEKLKAGYLYNPYSEEELPALHEKCMELCFDFNNCRPSDKAKQHAILNEMLGDIKDNAVITQPFYCDYGINIHIGENFYSNYNLVILDCADVIFGNNVFVAPNCIFTTAGHPIDTERRNQLLEYARPITVGDSVWFGTNVSVLPGVTIGSNVVIGAGSVVNRDIPDGVVAAGNPCHVIRKITEEDKKKYRTFINE